MEQEIAGERRPFQRKIARETLLVKVVLMNFSRSSILESYELGPTIGQGSFAVVKLCKNRKTGEEVAIKVIDKKNARAVEDLQSEAEVMAKIDHPNVIRVYQIFENTTKCYMVWSLPPRSSCAK
jgi:calcium-dependent protein kinase